MVAVLLDLYVLTLLRVFRENMRRIQLDIMYNFVLVNNHKEPK